MDSGKPHEGICLPCVDNKYAIREYSEKDFKFWHGIHFDVFDISVQEVKK